MKKFNIYYVMIIAVAASIFTSCKPNLPTPSAGITWYETTDFNLNRENPEPQTVLVGENITFFASGTDGDVYTVWPGEPGYDYTKRNLTTELANDTVNNVKFKNKGIALGLSTKDEWCSNFSFNYSKPGEYTVYLTVRTIANGGKDYVESVDSAKITVIDPVNELFGSNDAKYKFVVQKPKGATVSHIGNDVTISVPFGSDISASQLLLMADRASIELNTGTITYDSKKLAYTWTGDLATATKISVTSLSGDVQDYTLHYVTVAPTIEKELTSFGFDTYVGVINGTNVTLTVPEALPINSITPIFTVSTNATLNDGATLLVTKKDPKIDLSSGSKVLTVKAQDGGTSNYTINIVEIPTQLTAFSFGINPKITGIIDEANKTIDVTVFPGTDVTTLIPTFTLTQFAKAYVGTTEIKSGETERDFTSPVEIIVKVSATDFVTYTVTVHE